MFILQEVEQTFVPFINMFLFCHACAYYWVYQTKKQAALPQGIVPFVFAKEYNVHPDILSTG